MPNLVLKSRKPQTQIVTGGQDKSSTWSSLNVGSDITTYMCSVHECSKKSHDIRYTFALLSYSTMLVYRHLGPFHCINSTLKYNIMENIADVTFQDCLICENRFLGAIAP